MITPIEIGLAAAFGLTATASLALSLRLQGEQRRARDLRFELSHARARMAGEEQARSAIASEIGAVLRPCRALLEQQATAITRASDNLGAAVIANGQRFGDLDITVAELQGLARSLKATSGELAIARDSGPDARLPPDPAQVAAGIGPRPSVRSLSASATPHPPPVRVGPPSGRPPPPTVPPPPRRAREATPTLHSIPASPAGPTGHDVKGSSA